MRNLPWLSLILASVSLCLANHERGDSVEGLTVSSRSSILTSRNLQNVKPLSEFNLFDSRSSDKTEAEIQMTEMKYTSAKNNHEDATIEPEVDIVYTEKGKGKGKKSSKSGSSDSSGKGKGKGKGKGYSADGDDDSGKGSSKMASYPQQKKKGYESMNQPSEAKKSKYSSPHYPRPVPYPTPKVPTPKSPSVPAAPTANPPNTMPTVPSTGSPTLSPSVAPTPVGEVVQLSDFLLTYDFDRAGMPSTSDLEAAVTVTKTYLNGFSRQRLDDLKELEAERLLAGIPNPPGPYRIVFSARAFFDPGTDLLPSSSEMDLLVTLAFSGDNLRTYIGLLQQLPESNIFSSVRDVSDSRYRSTPADPPPPPSSSTSSTNGGSTSRVAIGASIGAGTFIALLLGIALCRRRTTYDELEKAAQDGHITVAGETYIGGSTVYTSSEPGGGLARGRLGDDTHSMWGISTKGGTDDDASAGGEPMEFDENTLEHQIGDLSDYAAQLDPLRQSPREQDFSRRMFSHDPIRGDIVEQYSSDNESGRITMNSSARGDLSEDESVPLRVVDLIRKFSPL